MNHFFFGDSNVRRVWHNNAWWFVVEDVVSTLSVDQPAASCIARIHEVDPQFTSTYNHFVRRLFVDTNKGSVELNCIGLEGVFRIVQSVNTPQAEPIKRWLAQLGKKRIDELTQNDDALK